MESDWVQAISATVSAAATVAILIATGVYVWYTRRLWQETQRSSETTRRIFEASHRPYLNIIAPMPVFTEFGRVRFLFHLDNRGSVPAVVTRWQVTVLYQNQSLPVRPADSREIARVVFPGGHERLALVEVGAPPSLRSRPEPLLVQTEVVYTGVAERSYSTQVIFELHATERDTMWDPREARLDR